MTTLNEGAARAALARRRQRRDRRDRLRPPRPSGEHAGGEQGGRRDRVRSAADPAARAEPRGPRRSCRAAPQRNLAAADQVEWAEDLTPTERILCVDAQTSGGLLLAVPPENEAALLAALREAATPAAAVIGRLTGVRPAGCG